MKALPFKARFYLFAVAALGIAAAMFSAIGYRRGHPPSLGETALFVGIAVIAYGRKIVLIRSKADTDAGSMTLGFAITFAAMLRLGPSGAMVVGAVGCLSSCLYPKRQAIHQLVFNTSVAAFSSWCCGIVFWSFGSSPAGRDLAATLCAVLASALTYYAANTVLVAGIIALVTSQPLPKLWRDTFLWTAPSYFAGACVGSVSVMLCRGGAWQIVLFVSPVAFLIYQSYAIYVSRAQEKQESIERLANLYLSTIKSLALAIDAKDQYTHRHILRVQRYAVAVAKHMGLTGDELEGVNTGALLHDIGKLGVPEYVLLKPGRLTDEEFGKIKKHPEIGAAILDPVEFPWPVLPVVKYHHEKWDGTGYPEGLKGEAIPRTARILAVADVYDALTSNRSYRHAWPHEKAVAEIERCSGTHFDPVVAAAFAEVIDGVVAQMATEVSQDDDDALVNAVRSTKSEEAARDIQRASSELWALYEVAETLSASIGLQESLDILGRKLHAILPGTTCLFLLKEARPDAAGPQDDLAPLCVHSATGPNQELFRGARTLNALSRSVEVARTRAAYRADFDPDDLLMVGTQSLNYEEMRASMIVPVVHQGETLGTINLYHCQEGAFEPHDQQLLEMIAARAANAIYNGMLFDRTESDAHTDMLTGLYNSRYLAQVIDANCRRAGSGIGGSFAVLCVDLDNFKPINENFGHQSGDRVLREVAGVFRRAVGPDQVVARYGGDEFVLVLEGVSEVEAHATAALIRDALESYDPGLTHERLGALRLGLSVGVACFPQQGADSATLISAADARMYRDKSERKLGSLAGRKPPRDARNGSPVAKAA